MRSGSRHRVQTGSPHWECSQGLSEDQAGAQTQNHCQVDPQNEQAHSQHHIQEPPNKKVSFQMPEDGDLVTESREPSAKLPIKDLESWLDYQADQLGTPPVGRIEGHPWHDRPPQVCPENPSILPCT